MRGSAVALVGACSAWLTVLLASASITPDTFMCLVLGRSVLTRGLPSVETLTSMGAGKPWVDQQWLAHVLLYAVEARSGFAGLLVLRVLVSIVACTAALAYAARSGASRWALVLGGCLGLALTAFKAKVRAQLFAEPLFVLTLCLLLAQARTPRWRNVVALAVTLSLWSNLHGSVLLGILLVLALCVVRRVECGWRGAREVMAMDAACLAAGVGSIFFSPYGLRGVAYYSATLANPLFRAYLEEWRSPDWAQGSFLIVIGSVSLALLIFRRRALSWFERAVMALLLGLSFYSVRHALFLGYALMFFLPLLIQQRADERGGWWGRSLAGIASLASALAVISTTRSFERGIEQRWPLRTSQLVEALAGSQGKVFAEMRHADRLLWQTPGLAGRIAFDARFELLTADQAQGISQVLSGRSIAAELRDYQVFVVSEPSAGPLLQASGFVLRAVDAQTQVYDSPRR
jgi:hypothetical protein